MAPIHAGMKRKARDDLTGQRDPKSPRLTGLDGNDQLPDNRVAGTERKESHTSTTPDVEEEKRKVRAQERETANEFLKRLVLFVELCRGDRDPETDPPPPFSDRCWTQLRRVCDMFQESALMVNPEIQLSSNPMSMLEDLSEDLKELQARQEEHDENISEWEAALISHVDLRQSEMARREHEIDTTERKLAKTEEACRISREQLDSMRHAIEDECSLPLRLARKHLLEIGLLRPSKLTEQRDVPKDKRNVRNDSTQRTQEGQTDRRPPKPEVPPRPMIEIMREEKCEGLRKAKKALKDIEEDREGARKFYGRNVRQFLRDVKDDRVTGTKSDFDRGFFMEQQKFTQDQRYWEEELARVRKDAVLAGELTQSSNFSDRPDDGYSDISDHGEDLLSDFKHDEILKWVDAEADRLFPDGQPAAVGEDDWSVVDHRSDPGGEKVYAFPDGIQPYLDEIEERPKWRQLIDDWRRKQEKVRLSMLPLRERHWWEECTGI